MSKKIVLVERDDEDTFIIWHNADQPGKNYNDACALREERLTKPWNLSIEEWLSGLGLKAHKDSELA